MKVITWLKGVFENNKQQSAEAKKFKHIDEQLAFVPSKPLTLGIEFELAVLNNDYTIAHKGLDIITAAKSPVVKKELFEHMVEVTTGVCADVHDAKKQLADTIYAVSQQAAVFGTRLTGTGRPPSIMLADCKRVHDERYEYLKERRKILTERFGTLGMHIHIGTTSADTCIRYHNFFMHHIPNLLALCASSPFEDGIDTGLASIRPTVTESLPVAGMPYHYDTWHDYQSLVRAMYAADSIRNLKDLWWDLRPCPHYGTLEIRICDQPATLAEAMAVTAFVHCLAHWFQEHQDWLEEVPRPSQWRLRENKWRAMRYGIDAQLVVNNLGETKGVRDIMTQWLDRLAPYVKQLNYREYIETLRQMLERGNSAMRQQAVWQATQNIMDVTRFNCQEFEAGTPLWDDVDALKAKVDQAQKTA